MTATRTAAGTRDSVGDYTPGSTSTVSFRGSVQPALGQDMKNLPEGTRQSDTRKVYADTELRTVNQHDGTPADLVTVLGVDYQVRVVGYEPAPIAHYKLLIVRVQE